MQVKRFHSLFVKAVIVLFFISMVPMLIIGVRIMKINNRLLRNEVLQRQQLVAERLALSVRNVLVEKEQLLGEFGDLHTDFGSYDLITKPDLAYLQDRNPSLFYLTIFSAKGSQVFDSGVQPDSLASVRAKLLEYGLTGGRYLSEVYYDPAGKPFIWLVEPLYRQADSHVVTGALVAAMYLDDVINTLLQIYPLDMDAMLVSAQGNLLSYNGAPEDLDASHSASLRQTLQVLTQQLNGRDSAEVTLPDGKSFLVSVARVQHTGWQIYLFQPVEAVSREFVDSFFHASFKDLLIVAFVMIIFVGVVSYLVIIPITRPLARLRAAAVKLREDENFVVHKEDVEIPHNEIGELASVFVDMSQTLSQRQKELISAQQTLSQMNQVLEKRVEERTRELKQATNELVKKERLAAIGQMASIISHEIRNPLAVISNATRLIKTILKPTDPKIIKQFSIIEDEIRQANGIISEVLGYARTRDMILSLVDVNSYLRELITSYPMPSVVTVVDELDPESVRIKVDVEEMKQALRNIISNAVESMPMGGTLTIGSQVGRRLVCIYIKDTGSGVSEEVRKEMFTPFFTTKARGTGLGLAVVRKAITRHKGKLFIKSELGKGTSFRIYLKIYRKVGDTNYGEAS